MNYLHELEFKVRDYECDLQGIVNNGVYQNYLEHARHEFLIESGVDFAALVKKKIYLVVVRAELDYKYPLKSGDKFWVKTNVRRSSKIRFEFQQDIFRNSDQKLMLHSIITGTSLNERGRPFVADEIADIFNAEG